MLVAAGCLSVVTGQVKNVSYPVVMWHGMGEFKRLYGIGYLSLLLQAGLRYFADAYVLTFCVRNCLLFYQ